MERRKILLGSGAAIATALAGCSSTETDDPRSDDESDDTTESFGDDTDGADGSEDGENGQDDTEGEGDADDVSEDDQGADESDGEDSQEQIPGFNRAEFETSTDDVSVTNVTRDDASVTVVAEADELDEDELNAELESGVLAFADSIDDAEAFTEEIDAVPWHINYNGFNVAVFEIESEWIVEYANGEISEDELEERILETA
ncbi:MULTISPECIES: hypothetical protein [Natrialbaceae]|uniref:hypothetical protein n=1 Tax=Natrialbaceae TaxID=1644061 RepID=UPI00207CE326|nr:hypothetical protein [Natronococcus sp. CG52]